MPPRPVIDREFSVVDNQPPGEYRYQSGVRVEVRCRYTNRGDAEGRCRILVFDEIRRETIFERTESSVGVDCSRTYGFWLTIDRDMDLVMHAQYYDAFRDAWITTDTYGVWRIRVGTAEEAPEEEEPRTEIDRNVTRIGDCVPGEYEITRGATVECMVRIVNTGGRGRCRFVIWDSRNRRVVYSGRSVTLDRNGRYDERFTITIDTDMTLMIEGQHYNGERWVTDDTWGDWRITVTEPPQPRAEVDREYTRINDQPPGEYEIRRGSTVNGRARIINRGGRGSCRILVWDSRNEELIYRSEGRNLNSGESMTRNFTVTIDRDRRIVVMGEHYNGERWVTDDTYGDWVYRAVEEVPPPAPPEEVPPAPPAPPAIPPGKVAVTVSLVNPSVRGIYVQIRDEEGKILKEDVLRVVGEFITVQVDQGAKLDIMAKKMFSFLVRTAKVEAIPGERTEIGGVNWSIRIENAKRVEEVRKNEI